MAIGPGTRLGPYEVTALLGEGGMGKVWRAHHTGLKRHDALKVLPDAFASDPDRLARFQREAQVLASLNHPNIAHVYGLECSEGVQALVMELVEGPTLAERIARGPIPVDEALSVAKQIAEALEVAHEQGVIHRDLKPANIKLTPNGTVKVLDFGLAKTVGANAADPDLSHSPTVTIAGTRDGVILGTAGYMSPEQARARPVDKRTDIWAFGCVLYEMLTGRRAFAGETLPDTIVQVLEHEPDWSALPAKTPESIRRLLRRCLDKDPKSRLRDIGDARVDLGAAFPGATTEGSLSRGATSRARIWAGIGSVAVLAAVFIGSWWIRPASPVGNAVVRSLAVLPLKSLGVEATGESLSLGIADAIITKISQIDTLTVRPTSAVRRFATQDIDALTAARTLKVDAILDGTVQRAGNRLRVSMNLLRVSDETSLWAESFDLSLADVFAVQDDVSREVVSRLRGRLSPREEARLTKHDTGSTEAHQYYLRGMYNHEKWTGASSRADVEAAIAMFQKAIEIDPNYALAHAQLAYAYTIMALFLEPGPVWRERADQELDRARALDPDLAEVHVVRAEFFFSAVGEWQFDKAIQELRLAQQLNPSVGHMSLGMIYVHIGLEEQALREMGRAIEIDPVSELNQNRLAEVRLHLGQYDAAIADYDQVIALDPNNPGFYAFSALPFLYQRRFDEGERRIERALALKPADPVALSGRALLMALRGDLPRGEGSIAQIVKSGRNLRSFHHAAFNIAGMYAVAGKVDKAIQWLKTTIESGMPSYPMFERDLHLQRIKSDPAFIQFMAETKAWWEGYVRDLR